MLRTQRQIHQRVAKRAAAAVAANGIMFDFNGFHRLHAVNLSSSQTGQSNGSAKPTRSGGALVLQNIQPRAVFTFAAP